MRHKTILLLQLIAAKAATPEGFFTADARVMQSEKNAAKLCRQQVADGFLVRVRAGQTTYAHFTTQTAANAWMHKHRETVLAKARTTISFDSKAQKPRIVAEIIRPAHVKTQVYLMPPPRNQTVTIGFLHSGYGAMQ